LQLTETVVVFGGFVQVKFTARTITGFIEIFGTQLFGQAVVNVTLTGVIPAPLDVAAKSQNSLTGEMSR